MRELMQQALEALERHGCAYLHHTEQYGAAINALRAALAERERADPYILQQDALAMRQPERRESEQETLPAGTEIYLHPPRREQDAAEITALRGERERLRFALSRIGGRCDTEPAYKIARGALEETK